MSDALRSWFAAEERVRALVVEVLVNSSRPAEDAFRLLIYVAGPAEAIEGKVREAAEWFAMKRAKPEQGA